MQSHLSEVERGGRRRMTVRRRALAAAAITAVAWTTACVPTITPGSSTPTVTIPTTGPLESQVGVLLTTGDRTKLLSTEPSLAFDRAGTAAAPTVINVDASARLQPFEGVGAALTDSAAGLLAGLDATQRSNTMADLFGAGGAHLSMVRVPLSSTDFSVDDHTDDDVAPPATDPTLAHFSLSYDDAHLVPLLRQALAINPSVQLVGSPWSAPGWMKVANDRARQLGLDGGTLAEAYLPTYARYLAKIAQGYADRGVPLASMTLQNEPAYSPPDYPGMLLSSDQEARLAAALDNELTAVGSTAKVLAHDHNWDLASRAAGVLGQPGGTSHIDGVAFHCYGGDPSAQSQVHDAFPAVGIYFTECSGTRSSGTFESNLLWNTEQLVVGATRNWGRSVLLWNLALDPSGGPHTGGCSDCRGVLTIDPVTGAVDRNEEYYALAQLGRAVGPGSVRVASSGSIGSISNVAFVNADGTQSMVLANSSPQSQAVTVRDGQRSFTYSIPRRSVATLTW